MALLRGSDGAEMQQGELAHTGRAQQRHRASDGLKKSFLWQLSQLMTQNWEERWIHQKAVLPFSETWTGWRVGQRGT